MNAVVTEKLLRRKAILLGWITLLYITAELLIAFIAVRPLQVADASEIWGVLLIGASAVVGAVALIPVAVSSFALRAGRTDRSRTNATVALALMWMRLVGVIVAAAVLAAVLGSQDGSWVLSLVLAVVAVLEALLGRSVARSARANARSATG
jgi:hypothetical protein